ncbi:hypothetical protein [Hymenobacter edaphi]|uniref:hypothetical protein n=1 Tax=Hymenobacter edaphi TaxID=2211146 RepID=UPI001057BCDB|nr:hypothetical protein [Hymenobacter edaphi]
MRYLLLIIGLLLSQLAVAQFSKRFEAGSYFLMANPGVRQLGDLKLRNERKLLVKTKKGKRLKLPPDEVKRFQLGSRAYVVAKHFHLSVNSRSIAVDEAFVQRLDSGQVVVMRYDHLLNTGADWLCLYRYSIDAYLLQSHPDSAVAVVVDYFDKARFRQQARPFLASRSDLAQMLDEGLITYSNLPTALHALNNNLPFSISAIPERKE